MAMSTRPIVANRFELLESIGQGGMGEVYRGLDILSGQPVAIKELRSDLVAIHPDIVERFAREGAALRALDHPNIVKVLATASEGGRHYIVMEYVVGGSL